MRKTALTYSIAFAFLAGAVQANVSNPPYGELITSGDRGSNQIALTFDDGPGPRTKEFLDLLDRYQVKATFFVLGELAGYRKDLLKEVRHRGHQIGDHNFQHLNYLKELKKIKDALPESEKDKAIPRIKSKLKSDLQKSRKIIESALGEKIHICRMPHGIDRPWIKEVALDLGYVLVNWTYGADWTKTPYEELEASYRKAVQPGAILLFHDGGTNRDRTLKLTEAVIQEAKAKGLELVSIDQLIGLRP